MMPLELLFTKKMSRKEFLLVITAMVLSFSLLEKFLHNGSVQKSTNGFGSGPYGGTRKETI